MGKLLFISTNRVNGWVGVGLCVAGIVLGVAGLVEGVYPALLFALAGALGMKYCLVIASQVTEVYESGFKSKNMFGQVSARYADLKSIQRVFFRRGGVVYTTFYLVTSSGDKVRVSNETFLKGDKDMEAMMDRLCGALAQSWLKRLELSKQVDWLVRGKQALLKIKSDGVIVEGSAPDFIRFGQFGVKDLLGPVEVYKDQKKMLTVNRGWPNFYTGLHLIDLLSKGKTASPSQAQPSVMYPDLPLR